MTGALVSPSPEATESLVARLDVRNNFAFLPHVRMVDGKATALLTLCNCYAVAFCAARGLWLPAKKANDQHDWLLSDDGLHAGWVRVDRLTAIRRANLGFTVLIVAHNPAGHGHIAMGVPNPHEPDRLYVTAAGVTNVTKALMENSFSILSAKALFFINTNEKGS